MKQNPLIITETVPENMHIASLSAHNVVFAQPVRLDFDLWLVVRAGSVSIASDIVSVTLGPNTFSVFVTGRILEVTAVSDDFEADIYMLSGEFLKSLDINQMLPLKMRFNTNPAITLSHESMEALNDYRRMASRIIELNGNTHKWESLMYLTRALYLGGGLQLFQQEKPAEPEDSVMIRFLTLVEKHATKHHSTQFYADQLCLTPKYLSKLIQQKTGKTAKAIISGHLLIQARTLLANSDMNIQQISDALGFPSQSVFGKFFKQATGLSPKAYKATHAN